MCKLLISQLDRILANDTNQTALLAALAHRWPDVSSGGLRSLQEEPIFYISAEGHYSFLKAARAAGLGANSVREIDVTDDLRIDLSSLRAALQRDSAAGYTPFLLVATAGTTGAGIIDPLPSLAALAQQEGLWFHVDAAWGGAGICVGFVMDLGAVTDGTGSPRYNSLAASS